MRRWLDNWLSRHRSRSSFWLHVLGIPLVAAACVLAVVQLALGWWSLWPRPAGLFAAGYALQWIGHRIEGNDMGEVIVVKRWLGLPYVAVSPRFAGPRGPDGKALGGQPPPAETGARNRRDA